MTFLIVFSLILFFTQYDRTHGETKINLNKKYQVIDGFGASSAWQGLVSDKIMDNLFNKAGLSILRIRIDEHRQWKDEVSNAKKALKYNALVFATPWTAEANLKVCWNDKSCPLNPNKYNDYADYLQSFVTYMKQNGAPLYAISMINEPDLKTDDYNTMNFTPQDLVKFLKTSAKRISGTKIMASESYGWSSEMNDAILNDKDAFARVDIIARHAYGFPMIPQTRVHQMGKHVWMTEFYTSGKDWKSVIELAKSIHNCIHIAKFNAYVHWWFNDNSTNMMLIDNNGELNAKAYVMAQFSKFIKRGYIHVDSISDNNNVLVSAYIGGQNKIVIVVVNMAVPITQQFSINGSITKTSLTPYITSQGTNLQKQININLIGGKFSYSLPGESIITFVSE